MTTNKIVRQTCFSIIVTMFYLAIKPDHTIIEWLLMILLTTIYENAKSK